MVIILSRYLHLQLSDVIYRPRLVVVVIIGNRWKAAGTLVGRDAAIREVLYGACAADPCFWNPNRHAWRLKVFTFQNFYID